MKKAELLRKIAKQGENLTESKVNELLKANNFNKITGKDCNKSGTGFENGKFKIALSDAVMQTCKDLAIRDAQYAAENSR